MIKRLLLIASVLFMMLPFTPAAAGDSQWSVWLYDQESHQLVRVFMDGTTQEVSLVPPDGYDFGEMEFSPDGNVMMACLFSVSGEGLMLTAYDILSAHYRFSYPVPPQESCKVSAGQFSPDGTQFALPSTVAQQGILSSWAVNVIDSASGTSLYRLDSSLDTIASYANFSPRVRHFGADKIVLSLQEYLSESALALMPVISWQPSTNTVGLMGNYPADMLSIAPNGEMVWLAADPAFGHPAAETLPGGDANVVMYQDAAGVSYPVFNDATVYLWGVQFIDAGRKIAVMIQDPISSTSSTVYLDRSGIQYPLPQGEQFSLIPAPTGYVTWSVTSSNTFELTAMEWGPSGEAQAPLVLWSSPRTTWTPVWSGPNSVAEGLPAFPPIGQ